MDDVCKMEPQKTLVLVHAKHGFKLLLRLFDKHLNNTSVTQVCGYDGLAPPKNDDQLKRLMGTGKCERTLNCNCDCNLCKFNRSDNLRGEKIRVMVADAKQCSEGVSFFAVQRLHLVDVPLSWTEYVQRIGRAVRFNGHANLLPKEKKVEVILYQAQLPQLRIGTDDRTADEKLLSRLGDNVEEFEKKLQHIRLEVSIDGPLFASHQSEVVEKSDRSKELQAAVDAVNRALGPDQSDVLSVRGSLSNQTRRASLLCCGVCVPLFRRHN